MIVRGSETQLIFHQSSQSKQKGLKGPVRSGDSANGYRTGATARGSATETMELALRKLV